MIEKRYPLSGQRSEDVTLALVVQLWACACAIQEVLKAKSLDDSYNRRTNSLPTVERLNQRLQKLRHELMSLEPGQCGLNIAKHRSPYYVSIAAERRALQCQNKDATTNSAVIARLARHIRRGATNI